MKGSCVCGKVTYKIIPPFRTFQYCHCSRCRKFTGSAQAPNLFVPPAQFQWQNGQEYVGRFEHPDAKYFLLRAFVKTVVHPYPGQSKVVKILLFPQELSMKILAFNRNKMFSGTQELPGCLLPATYQNMMSSHQPNDY